MKIYCSGIGGIGLSAYAALQNANGHRVAGSDRVATPLTDDLESQGISFSANQDGSHIDDDIDLFVYSEAIPDTAPERIRAKELDVPQRTYFEALGDLSKNSAVIAVAGTHGKSSTTAMAAEMLVDAGLDPTIIVGTKLPYLDGRNWRQGSGNIFLLEACEYRGSFLHLHPDMVLLLNADGDHFDAFETVEAYQEVFKEFMGMIPEGGTLITHMSDSDCAMLAEYTSSPVVDGDQEELISMTVPGRHMQENAQLCLALAKHLGIEIETAKESLAAFKGSWRRMEEKGEYKGAFVIDDYAHHPREITAVLSAMKDRHSDKKLKVVYQPHMHDRTLKLYDDFTPLFQEVDHVYLMDVYDARPDAEDGQVDIEGFGHDIAEQSSVLVEYIGNPDSAEEKLRSDDSIGEGDLLLFMGAGDITNVATALTS